MTAIDIIGSQPGRLLRIGAGVGLVVVGLRRRDGGGRLLGALGLVPLAAGAGDVCLLGPLVHGPLRGEAFRMRRTQQER